MATKGIWIPIEVLQDKNLTWNEKLILMEISQLEQLDKGCYASNQHFADMLNMAKSNASRTITNLEKKGYIETEIRQGSRNRERSIKMIQTCYQNDTKVVSKCIESKEKKTINKTKSRAKPTLEEIIDYIKEKDFNVDAKHFFEYFEDGNWIDSNGNKVRNWKQKLRTWHNHSKPQKEDKVQLWG